MVSVSQVYTAMKALAPLALAAEWDNPGLLVDSGTPVAGVLVTLDITAAVVEEAVQNGCSLIVSHHPVIFHPLKRLDPQEVAYRLVENHVSAICMHTNLDAAAGGVNDVLAGLFGMQGAAPFLDGCGRVGAVAPTDAAALAAKAGQVLHTSVKFADAGRPIRRLAVISGSGGDDFAAALAQGADALLTGEASHHDALDAVRCGLSLVAATHYATEWPVVPVLAQKLGAALPGLPVLVSKTCHDPFTYQ